MVKVLFTPVPTAVAPPMMATEMSAAIKPYSMAVAPDSFLRKRATSLMPVLLYLWHWVCRLPDVTGD